MTLLTLLTLLTLKEGEQSAERWLKEGEQSAERWLFLTFNIAAQQAAEHAEDVVQVVADGKQTWRHRATNEVRPLTCS